MANRVNDVLALSWSPFQPHWLLPGGHAQTMFAAMRHVARSSDAKQHVIPADEGDQLVLHDDCPAGWQPGTHCALLIHGLGGCHASPYMVRIAQRLVERNIRVFRLDMRGCGAGMRLAQKPGHAGRSEDVTSAVAAIAQLTANSPLVAVGFSLGGNLLLKMLGERRPADTVRRAMAVAPPADLAACARNMQRRAMMLYNRWFVRALLRELQRRSEFIPQLATLSLKPPPRSLYEFDDRVTAPLSGFASADEYYCRASSAPLLQDIETPTLILADKHDPIVPYATFDHLLLSSHVHLLPTRRGGHIGYVGRAANTDPDVNWLDWRVVEFVLGEAGHGSPATAFSGPKGLQEQA